MSSRELNFLNLTQLLVALKTDPDLSHIHPDILPQVLQTLHVSTGCDYTSFFSKIGKATFFRYFCQYASFITSGSDPTTPGTLSHTSIPSDEHKLGFLAFIRLVGTA